MIHYCRSNLSTECGLLAITRRCLPQAVYNDNLNDIIFQEFCKCNLKVLGKLKKNTFGSKGFDLISRRPLLRPSLVAKMYLTAKLLHLLLISFLYLAQRLQGM